MVFMQRSIYGFYGIYIFIVSLVSMCIHVYMVSMVFMQRCIYGIYGSNVSMVSTLTMVSMYLRYIYVSTVYMASMHVWCL